MKEILTNLIFIVVSMISANLFLWHVKKKYGMRPSISNSAKYLREDGNQALFFFFIMFGVCILAFVGNTYVTVLAAMLLFGIGVITGYNPNLVKNKFQDVVHILLTNGAILGFVVGVILINPWLSIVIVAYGIPCFIMYLKKVSCHTWKIEVLTLWAVWTCLLIERVILPLIKMY